MFFIFFLLLLAPPTLGWQDDVDLIFIRRVFNKSDDLTYLPSAQGQVRLGRYVAGDYHHGWRGGLLGDIGLLSINKSLLWHWGLNIETLVDDHNEIYFRLVQVYYQTKTGISWQGGPGVLTGVWQHRCSHGADSAVAGRILIRSGPQISYTWPINLEPIHLDIRATTDFYVIGQNSDYNSQARASFQLSGQALLKLSNSWSMILSGGFLSELRSSSKSSLYNLATPWENLQIENLFSTRIAFRFKQASIINDYAILFSQIADTGLTNTKNKFSGLSFDVNFYW